MESRITIHTGEDFKPVIKIIEKQSDDVKDNLVQGFRELLRHESRTCSIDYISVPESQGIRAGYYISPVSDEKRYAKDILLREFYKDEYLYTVRLNLKETQKVITGEYKGLYKFTYKDEVQYFSELTINFDVTSYYDILLSVKEEEIENILIEKMKILNEDQSELSK